MKSFSTLVPLALCAAAPALAAESEDTDPTLSAADEAEEQQPAPPQAGAPPAGAPPFRPVFDETWATIGLGAGLVPTYAGSDNFQFFPLPLIAGRVGGVGIRPSAAGLTLDLLAPKPSLAPRTKPTLSLGPTFRFRNDRAVDTGDDVVNAAGRLDSALELGISGGVSFPGVFGRRDAVTLSVNARHDVLGAHDGFVIEPGLSYITPVGRGMLVQVGVSAEIVDDGFADYYFSVSPAQSLASGLPVFAAEGGLNRIGTLAIVTQDLDGNALNGGLNVYGLLGYSRMQGDGADNPYTALRGDPNQFLLGLGLGYTF